MVVLGGLGEESYHHNSSGQAQSFIDYVAPVISEAIERHRQVFSKGNRVHVADLGCGSGCNTIQQVEYVVNKILNVSSAAAIQVHFSDLPENDFNSLFMSLNASQGQPYYYDAVPGSYYTRLLPDGSIHFAMSNISLHWLSKVPEEVVNKDSPAWNPGKVWISRSSPAATAEAYSRLAHEDLSAFLKCRAEELVPGGILSLSFIARPSEEQLDAWDLSSQAAWEALVDEGTLTQESLDSYNMNLYCRSRREAEETLELCDLFHILYKEEVEYPKFDRKASDYVEKHTRFLKTLSWNSVLQHLGDEKKAEKLYQKTMSIVETRAYPATDYNVLVFVLERHLATQ